LSAFGVVSSCVREGLSCLLVAVVEYSMTNFDLFVRRFCNWFLSS
jgi:hypothetical protein